MAYVADTGLRDFVREVVNTGFSWIYLGGGLTFVQILNTLKYVKKNSLNWAKLKTNLKAIRNLDIYPKTFP